MPPHPDTFPPVAHVLDYLAAYERRYEIPVRRPVRVSEVTAAADHVTVHTDSGPIRTRQVINTTGTWAAPFVPAVPGADRFRGRQLHSANYAGPEEFAGRRVAVVGGANSAAQIVADLTDLAEVSIHARKPLHFLPDDVDGRDLFAQATARVRDPSFRPSYEGDIVVLPPVLRARAKGALRARPTFNEMTRTGAVVEGEEVPLDVVIWCTGFRPALRHLRRLGLATRGGLPVVRRLRSVTDPRIAFIGYGTWTGPASATLIGVGRPARELVNDLTEELAA